MSRRRPKPSEDLAAKPTLGETAHTAGKTLNSSRVDALPILNHMVNRLCLEEFFRDHLPSEDSRCRVPTSTTLLLLLKNILISREPLYGVGEWSSKYVLSLLELTEQQLSGLNDDRVGRSLDRLFDADIPSLTLCAVAHAVQEFGLDLNELHNDSTTVTFHGDYESADEERTLRGQLRLAINHGHNKDHRPDLKQLLYILTVTRDGAVPVQFRVESGNTTDDRTHQATWEVLCTLTKRRDFLYVADCKLATSENMAYIHQRGGRFLTVLPRTRNEDTAFRSRVRSDQVQWKWIHDKCDEDGNEVDQYSIYEPEAATIEGYRLIWYRSVAKAEHDTLSRFKRLERAGLALVELKAKLTSKRTRFRERAKVAQAVEKLQADYGTEGLIAVTIEETTTESYRQENRGRPGPETRYVKQEGVRFNLDWKIDLDRLSEQARCDGIFPMVTNVRDMSALDLLLAYKQQPAIEKRFEQLKTDFVVAPVFLKEVSRIQALLCIYFFALLVESLLERELRRAMERKEIDSLPLYPEGRACRRPTARRVIDQFENIQRHELIANRETHVFATELNPLQRKILGLLGIPEVYP